MADNRLPETNLPAPAANSAAEDARVNADRRALVRRAAIGLPVLLATVHGRTVWARQEGSGKPSGGPSQQIAPTQP